MQSVEEKKNQYNVIIKTCYATSIIYLAFRLLYFVLFLVAQTWVVFYVNLGSIFVYLLCFLLIKKKKYYIYTLVCGNEFLVLMSICTIFLGFNTGFHLCVIGLCVVSFFSVYFSRKENKNISKAITWSVLSIIVYLGIYLYTCFNAPKYQIDKWLEISLFILHTLAVFAFIVVYLLIFLRYAMKLEDKIINESRTDELTKLPNRYELCNYLDSLEDKRDYALAIFDIDDFKKFNDEYGHIYGDFVLKEIAHIANLNSEGSFVARYGGEEFIVIIKLFSDDNRAIKVMEGIRELIEKHEFVFEGVVTHSTISSGIARYEPGFNLDLWVDAADRRLYKCKETGKNKVIM